MAWILARSLLACPRLTAFCCCALVASCVLQKPSGSLSTREKTTGIIEARERGGWRRRSRGRESPRDRGGADANADDNREPEQLPPGATTSTTVSHHKLASAFFLTRRRPLPCLFACLTDLVLSRARPTSFGAAPSLAEPARSRVAATMYSLKPCPYWRYSLTMSFNLACLCITGRMLNLTMVVAAPCCQTVPLAFAPSFDTHVT